MGRLVLAGAGHAHMTILSRIKEFRDKGHEVQVVNASGYHYYSGMGPGMLGTTYEPRDIRFNVREMTHNSGGTFIKDHVLRIDPAKKTLFLKSGKTITYDVVSFNTGSYVPSPVGGPGEKDVFTVKPIKNLLLGRDRIFELAGEKIIRIGVVGGGPAGLEVAGNAWAAAEQAKGKGCSVRLYCGPHLLRSFPSKLQRKASHILEKRGIQIVEGSYAKNIRSGRIELEDGRKFTEDLIFLALGVKPSPLFKESGLPTGPNGGLKVNTRLQCENHPDLFGGGDCIHFTQKPLDKVGVYAVRENPVLAHNVLAKLEGRPLKTFDPGGKYLLIFNLGDGKGLFCKKHIVFDGKLAFWIKNFIDKRFIRNFSY